jgi:hypothetical protein
MTDLDLIAEVRGLRGDVRDLKDTVAEERRGRKLLLVVGGAVVVVALLLIGVVGVNWVRDGRVTCAERTRTRTEIRAAISVAVDRGARALGATDEERLSVRDDVDDAVLAAYPPPDC